MAQVNVTLVLHINIGTRDLEDVEDRDNESWDEILQQSDHDLGECDVVGALLEPIDSTKKGGG